MSSAGVVATLDTTATGLSTLWWRSGCPPASAPVRDPCVGALSASGIQIYSHKGVSGRRAERVSEAPAQRSTCRIQLGDDVAPLVMDEVGRAIGRTGVGDDAADQLLEAVVETGAAQRPREG
ncbi:MAG: hypothetical protein AB7S74_17845 [Hyphomicrobium sp.]